MPAWVPSPSRDLPRAGGGQEGGGRPAGALGGVAVVLDQGGDDGALAEEHPLVGDLGGVREAGRLGQLVEVVAGAGLVGQDRPVGGVGRVGELDGGVDERAAAERLAAEPVSSTSNTASSRWVGSSAGCDLSREPGEEPVVQHVQTGGDQLVLGAEVTVEGDLGETGLGRDRVDVRPPGSPAGRTAGRRRAGCALGSGRATRRPARTGRPWSGRFALTLPIPSSHSN